jgi:hypothetical protein
MHQRSGHDPDGDFLPSAQIEERRGRRLAGRDVVDEDRRARRVGGDLDARILPRTHILVVVLTRRTGQCQQRHQDGHLLHSH